MLDAKDQSLVLRLNKDTFVSKDWQTAVTWDVKSDTDERSFQISSTAFYYSIKGNKPSRPLLLSEKLLVNELTRKSKVLKETNPSSGNYLMSIVLKIKQLQEM